MILSNYKMDFMKMSPDNRFTHRKTDMNSGEQFYELTDDLYSLGFFAFYIDDEERDENYILQHFQNKDSNFPDTQVTESQKSDVDKDERISMSKFQDKIEELKISKDDFGHQDIVEHLKVKKYLRRL